MRVLQACWLLAQRTGGVTGCKTIDAGPPPLGPWAVGLVLAVMADAEGAP